MTGQRRWSWPRLTLLAGLSPLLALSTCYERPPARHSGEAIRITALQAPRSAAWPASLTLEGAWSLASLNRRFGSYSALVAMPDGRLIAYSDRGDILGLRPRGAGWASARMARVAADPEDQATFHDIESATYDAASGTVWLGLEGLQAIRRFRAGEPPVTAKPDAMAGWPDNGGPEAMARLQDGHFIVLAERDATLSREPGEGLLFPRDPLLGDDDPVHFRFVTDGGFQPTDMAALPDGRVLILMRALDLAWPPFRSRLVIADPRDIVAGEPWPWQLLADIAEPQFRENYEGMAVVPRQAGGVTIWLISDDNAAQLQRTLLLKLAWTPQADAAH